MVSNYSVRRLNTGTTNADLFGVPSDQDIRDMGAYGSNSLVGSKGKDDGSLSSHGSHVRLPLGINGASRTAPAK
jgi:hypothetical protein